MKSMIWAPGAATLRAVTAEDVCRIALSAYYAAAAGMDMGPLDSDGLPWQPGDEVMPPAEFADYLDAQIQARLVLHGYRKGIEFPYSSTYAFKPLATKIDPFLLGRKMNDLPPAENDGKTPSHGALCHDG